jgi:hypothetical protein
MPVADMLDKHVLAARRSVPLQRSLLAKSGTALLIITRHCSTQYAVGQFCTRFCVLQRHNCNRQKQHIQLACSTC